MLRARVRICACLSLLLACHPDHGGEGGDAGDGDGPPDVPMLADNLGIDLAQVGSFVVQVPAAGAPTNDEPRFREGGGTQLFALTLDGEAIEVSLLSDPPTGAVGFAPPSLRRVHALPGWVLFESWGYSVYELDGDAMPIEIPCTTIAARRSDGALFCSELGIRSSGDNYGNVEPGAATVLGNATGEVLYIVSIDEFNADIMYRVDAPGLAGLDAVWIESIWRPRWAAVNATGDLLIEHSPPGVTAPDSLIELYPVAEGAASLDLPNRLAGAVHSFGIAGQRGSAEQDVFYLLEVGQAAAQSQLQVLAKQGDGFMFTTHPLALQNGCGFLQPLADGIYAICNDSIARVIEAGEVLSEPVYVPLGAVTPVQVGGGWYRFAAQQAVFIVDDGTTQAFMRHDGLSSQLIPFGGSVELLGVSLAASGALDFVGISIDTHERVIGQLAAGADSIEVLAHENIDPAAVVSFTPLD